MKLLLSLLLGCALLSSFTTQAQTSYRWTDPKTGQMVISDKPPPAGVKQVSKYQQGSAGDDENSNLSYATRKAMKDFPVKLYTSADCVDLCRRGRDLLNARGIPFKEKMVSTPEDVAELKSLTGGEPILPVLTVGRQTLKGMDETSWNNILDLADYPKSSYGTKPSGGLPK
ncbi:MAG: glutaredoxin family protein [Betaproteobacteria bacterium]|nr:glutaredoxin family protein [Betaproteobacteria bacterium]